MWRRKFWFCVVMFWFCLVIFRFRVVIFRFCVIIFWFRVVIFKRKWNENSGPPKLLLWRTQILKV